MERGKLLQTLEVNICQRCRLIIELISGVGWLHVAPLRGRRRHDHPGVEESDLDCADPSPSMLRCSVCLTAGPTRVGSMMRAHGTGKVRRGGIVGRDELCPGSGQPGLAPLDESAAWGGTPR